MVHLKLAIPVLASSNDRNAVGYNEEKLGFDKIGWVDDPSVVMVREYIEIPSWKCNDKFYPGHNSRYIRITFVDELYHERQCAEVVYPNGPLQTQAWGMREFAILAK